MNPNPIMTVILTKKKRRFGQRHLKTQGKERHDEAEQGGLERALPSQPSKEANPADTPISDFQLLELRDNKCLALKPPGSWCFATAAQAN